MEKKKTEQFRFSQTFYQCFHSIFFPRCIYTRNQRTCLLWKSIVEFIYKLTLLKVRRIQLDTKYIYLDLFRKQFILHHYMIARITKGRGGGHHSYVEVVINLHNLTTLQVLYWINKQSPAVMIFLYITHIMTAILSTSQDHGIWALFQEWIWKIYHYK